MKRLINSTPCLALAIFLLATIGLTGCSAVMTTTNTVAKTMGSVTNGLASSSDVSVTAPEGVHSARAREYVNSQIAMIRSEAATGGGENIKALATLMGQDNPQAFGEWMQANYAKLFTDLDKPAMLVARIHRLRRPPGP